MLNMSKHIKEIALAFSGNILCFQTMSRNLQKEELDMDLTLEQVPKAATPNFSKIVKLLMVVMP